MSNKHLFDLAKKDLIDIAASKLPEVISVLKSSGKSRNLNDFPILQHYLEDTGQHPFIKNFSEIHLNHVSFFRDFKRLCQKTLHLREFYEDEKFTSRVEYGVFKLSKGYIAEINVAPHTLDNFDISIHELLEKLSRIKNTALASSVVLYCPPDDSPLKDEALEKKFTSLVKKNKLPVNEITPCVGMICYEDGEYFLKDFYIKKDYTIIEPDLHYGKGFSDFHSKLISRFKNDSKGLVLFHGLPGTGKTFYIRSLMKDLLSLGKFVIYLQPSMVDSLIDPSMMNFLSSVVMERAQELKSCVLLLEDAEPLLTSRKTDNRSNGITNLLNITDGILNDMLNVQVIATFNTEISNIDDALLRPERLIARKEFRKLKKEDAQKLANFLKIEKSISQDSTLAEIYSQSKHNEILIHEYNSEERKIGFIR